MGKYNVLTSYFLSNESEIEIKRFTPEEPSRSYSILTIPGFNSSFSDYEPHAVNFAERGIETHVASLRGHAGSSGRPGVESVRRDVRNILDFGGYSGDIALIGNSFGGYVGLQPALDNERVGAICLIATPDKLPITQYLRYVKRVFQTNGSDQGGINFRFGILDYPRVAGEILLFETPLSKQMGERTIEKPILFVIGGKDEIIPYSNSEDLLISLYIAAEEGLVSERSFEDQGHKLADVQEELDEEILCFFDRSFGNTEGQADFKEVV